MTERLQATPGLPLMLVLALGIYLFFRNKTDPWFRCSLLFSVLTIWLSTDTFFWNGLTLHVPGWRVLAQMIQFPWRFFEFSILFITALISGISVRDHFRKIFIGVCAASVLMVFWFMGSLMNTADVIDPIDTSSVDARRIGEEQQYVLQGSDQRFCF